LVMLAHARIVFPCSRVIRHRSRVLKTSVGSVGRARLVGVGREGGWHVHDVLLSDEADGTLDLRYGEMY
jgi:hypothetical protein